MTSKSITVFILKATELHCPQPEDALLLVEEAWLQFMQDIVQRGQRIHVGIWAAAIHQSHSWHLELPVMRLLTCGEAIGLRVQSVPLTSWRFLHSPYVSPFVKRVELENDKVLRYFSPLSNHGILQLFWHSTPLAQITMIRIRVFPYNRNATTFAYFDPVWEVWMSGPYCVWGFAFL